MTWGGGRPVASGRVWVVVAASLAAGAAPLRADQIRLTGGADYKSVRVIGVSEGQVVFRTSGGRELRKPLARISYVHLDAIPSLGNVERLMSRAEYRQAAAAYERLQREAVTTWQKRLIESRLLIAYDREGRFDKAVETYVELLQDMGPGAEDLAPKHFPSPASRFYTPALGAIERAAVANNMNPATRAVLERFAAVVRAAQAGGSPDSAGDGDAAGASEQARGRAADTPSALARARAALAAGRHDEAAQISRDVLAQAPKEARPELLYIKGVCELKLARSRASKLSAGLTLMRVVAADESSPFAAAALYQVGLLYESLDRRAKALQLLEEARSHPAGDEALKADTDTAITRLRAETNGRVKD